MVHTCVRACVCVCVCVWYARYHTSVKLMSVVEEEEEEEEEVAMKEEEEEAPHCLVSNVGEDNDSYSM